MRKVTDQEQARRQKLELLKSSGIDPFPARLEARRRIADVHQRFAEYQRSGEVLGVAGRVRALRLQGRAMFLDLEDGSGKLQCFLGADDLGPSYDQLVAALDLGDFLQATGTLFKTKRGEETLKAAAVTIIAKALKPLPDKRQGLAEVELRYRHRELDLIANRNVRHIFITRSQIITTVRQYLLDQGFLEVETPILQLIPGGATARPFVTHHHALNLDLYLRVAPELYLKRLVIGGLERVFEIGRCFRNEGIDHQHNPEFTQVELYAAYMDYQGMMQLTESLLRQVILKVHDSLSFPYGDHTINFKNEVPRVTFKDLVFRYAKINIDEYSDTTKLAKKAKDLGLDVTNENRGKILDVIFKSFVRPKIVDPTFVIDHPVELSPLAKKKTSDPRYVERFQLLVAGAELCNAFSELNDPIDQRARFEEQEKLRTAGDEEAQRLDEDFLEALAHGMPPTAGLGIGLDRLVMLLTNQRSIKEVIAFPTLKPKQ
ncbi:MAG: lysine--tRNA ligase [Candidatus Kerfeldbacteria bacterium]|nr:lysine--tRNA ligase [Candidatus Kerfeldbacteria bacterium]